jgi:hypothetical protein
VWLRNPAPHCALKKFLKLNTEMNNVSIKTILGLTESTLQIIHLHHIYQTSNEPADENKISSKNAQKH